MEPIINRFDLLVIKQNPTQKRVGFCFISKKLFLNLIYN